MVFMTLPYNGDHCRSIVYAEKSAIIGMGSHVKAKGFYSV